MMFAPPKVQEVKEFQFKLHSRLRIFHGSSDAGLFQNNVNILCSASRYGLMFAGHPTGFRVFALASLPISGSAEQKEYEHRNIELGSKPIYLSVNADGTLLVVVVDTPAGSLALVYDLLSLTSQNVVVKHQLRLTESPDVVVQDLQWNPAIPNLISFIYSNGSVCVYELKGGPFGFISLPETTLASCHSWSPKGKQIVIGSKNGTLTQYKPDLKAVKAIAAPSFIQNASVLNVHWLSSFQFCAAYRDAANPEDRPSIVIVNTPKNEPIQYINYEDICFSMGTIRPPQFYMIHQQSWNVLLVSSANSMEVGVLAGDGKTWAPWTQIDEGRAELPADPTTKNETYPVGFTLDLSSVQPIPWGAENQLIPPMPILAILSHTGVLCLFHVVNLLPTCVPVCATPEPVPDKSAVQFAAIPAKNPEPLSSPQQVVAAPQQTIQASPVKPAAPANESLNISTAAPFTPQQNQSFSSSTPAKPVNAPKKLDFSFGQNTSLPPSSMKQLQSDISGVGLIPEKPLPSSMPSFGAPCPEPTPVAEEPEPENTANAKAVKSVANNAMYIAAVFDEIKRFEAELKDFKNSATKLDITVGKEDEKSELKKNVDGLESFYKELKETTGSLNLEVDSLKTVLMEAFSWIEDAKARKMQMQHPGYQNMVRLQELDPVSLQRLNSIQSSFYYVESQLKQANSQLDSVWVDMQDSIGKNKNKMAIPTLESVFQTMVAQKSTLEGLNSKIDGLASKVKNLKNNKPFVMALNASETINGDSELSKLAESLMKVKLNQTGKSQNPSLEAKRHLILLARKQMLSEIKEAKLKELQSTHTPRRIKPAKLKVKNGSLFGSSIVLPLPSSETSSVHSPKTSISPAQTSILTDTPPKSKDQPSFVATQPASRPTQNGSIFGLAAEKEKTATFSFGKESGGLLPKPVSQPSVQFSFKTPAAPLPEKTTEVPQSPSPKTILNVPQTKPNLSPLSTSEKAKEATNTKPDAKVDGVSMFGSSPFGLPKSDEVTKSPVVSELNFGSLGFGSPTATSKPAVSMFGNTALNTSSLFGAKPEPSKSEASPLSSGLSTPSAPPTSTLASSVSASAASPAAPAVSFSFAGAAAPTKNPPEASKSEFSKFSFTPSVAPAPQSTAVSTPALSFGSKPAPVSTVTTASVFSPLNLSVTSPATNSTGQSVFSFSSATTTASAAVTSSTDSKPAFNFGQALTPAQSSLGTFSFGNLKSQVSLFGGQCKSTETSETPASTVATAVTSAPPVAISPAGLFGGLSVTPVSSAAQPVFSSPPATTASVFASSETPTTTSGVFGSTTTTSTSIFGAPAITTAPGLFGSSPGSVFGLATSVAASTPPSSSVFGQPTSAVASSTAAQSTSVFGQASPATPTPPTQSVFGQATSGAATTLDTSSVFGQATSVAPTTVVTSSVFGQSTPAPVSAPSTPSVFAQATAVSSAPQTPINFAQATAVASTAPATPSVFGQATPVASAAPQTPSIFGQATAGAGTTLQTPNMFGRPQTTTASVFGGVATPAANTGFGPSPPASTKPSIFGNSPGLFATATTTSASVFSSPNTAATTAANTSMFGTATTTAPVSSPSFFGQAICSPNATAGNTGSVFGQAGSVFGGQPAGTGGGMFGSPPAFGGKPAFGQSGGSLFGNSSTSFGPSSGGSIFGSPNNTTALGGNAATSPVFGQSPGANTSGGIFGGASGGSFSPGLNQSVGQTGFGTSGFQNKPASGFGAPPTFGGSPSFGSATPAFGAPPAFGSPPSVFGSSSPTSAFGGGGAMANQSSPTNATFENLAKQNTVSFGNLAQNQSPSSFGNTNLFGGSTQNPNAFQKPQSPQFGGSSFSSWR